MSPASETVDEAAEEEAHRLNLALRLKRLLTAPRLPVERLRWPKAAHEDVEPEAEREATSAASGEEAGRRRLWRLLPYLVALVMAGVAAGGGATYWFSSRVIARQAAELGERQAEITRLKGTLTGHDKLLLQLRKKLEEEQAGRASLEDRLASAQSEPVRLASPLAEPRSDASNLKSATSPASAGKGGNCTLRPGTIGNTLKDCLAEFNRP